MKGARNGIFFCPTPWGPGEGSKGQISFNFNYKVNFKDFYTKLCVCSHKFTNERYKTYQTGFLFCCLWWDFGVHRWSFFFKHGHVAYQIDENDEQNRMHVTFLS